MNEIFKIASNISTPLALGGFFAAIFFYIIRQIISKNIYSKFSKKQSSSLMSQAINKAFVLAIVAMFLGFVGYLVPNNVNKSSDELIEILNQRATKVLDNLEKEKERALVSIRLGKGKMSEDNFLKKYQSIRELFIELHKKNIEAINSGQFALSHELVLDIHHLLMINARDIIYDAYEEPGFGYAVKYKQPNVCAKDYPGPLPEYVNKSDSVTALLIWSKQNQSPKIDFNRINRIRQKLQ